MSQLDIKIRKLQDNGSTFRANIETLYLGGVRSAKVDELRFELPEEWKNCTVTLHVQRLSGTKPDPQLLDEQNSALVDRRWTLEKEGTWMLLAINDSGYIAMTKPGKYTCYDTIDTDTTTENITPSIYEQFVAEVTKYAKQALESMNAAKTSETAAKQALQDTKTEHTAALQDIARARTIALTDVANSTRTATTAAENATQQATDAAGSASTAATKAGEASASAGEASTSRQAAEKAQKAAEDAAKLAGTRAGTDKTLSVPDAPADAKTVGDKFKSIKTDWNSVTDKPETFPPSAHTHSYAGSSSAGGDATRALGIKDYGGSKTIEIGYETAGLTTSNLTHIAGYTENGTKIKDVSKDVLKSWLDLGSAAYEANTIVRDVGDGRALTFNYSADAVNYNDFTWVPVWIDGQMKTVHKNAFFASVVQSSGSDYIRFGDVTQICWYSIYSNGDDYTWSFPVAFSNTEYSVVGSPISLLSFVCKDKRTTSCTLPGTKDTLCHGIAVGRWW